MNQQSNQTENKKHVKYFKHGTTMATVSLAIMIVGGVGFFFGRTAISYYVPLVAVPIAFVLFLVATIGRSTDADIESLIQLKTADMEVDLQNNERVRKGLLKPIGPLTVSGYECREGMLTRRAKNSELRTPEYSRAILYPLTDALYVVSVRVHVLTEEAERETFEIPYAEISDISIVTEPVVITCDKKQYRINQTHLCVQCGNTVRLSLPTKESASIDNFVEDVKQFMKGGL